MSSSIRLKTKQDIKEFFKILAEESVNQARSRIFEMSPTDLLDQRKEDDKAYKNIREEEEEIADDLDVTVDPDPVPAGTPVVDEEVVDEEAVEDKGSEINIEDVSLDAIKTKINAIRGGLSLRDSSVEEPLRTWMDLLENPERKALYAFLTALADLMTGESSGENADDPSDPPYNVKMQAAGGDEGEPAPAGSEETAEEEVEVEEDPSTPIRVGGVQSKKSISEIREKVISLLGKS